MKDQLAQQKQQHEAQLQEYIQLIDIKAARVKKLEVQLKEIAYGTKPYRLDTSKFEYADEDEGESVELERGQNLLQFCISQVVSSECLYLLGSVKISGYHYSGEKIYKDLCTLSFYF